MAQETSIAQNSSPAMSARYCYIITNKARGTKSWFSGCEYDITISNLPASEGGGSQVFTQAAIAHSGFKKSQDFEDNGVQVSVPKDDGLFGPLFLSSITTEIRIKIIRLSTYANQPEALDYNVDCYVVTEGVVTNMTFDDSFATAEIIPEAYAQNFSVPRFWFTRQCNHQLFGEGCNVDSSPFIWDATVKSINRGNRTVTIFGQYQNQAFWEYGTLSHDLTSILVTIVRTNFNSAGNTRITTNNWLPEIKVGDGVRLLPGCRRTPGDCQNKFNNAANFGGFHKIPTRDSAKHGISGNTPGSF